MDEHGAQIVALLGQINASLEQIRAAMRGVSELSKTNSGDIEQIRDDVEALKRLDEARAARGV